MVCYVRDRGADAFHPLLIEEARLSHVSFAARDFCKRSSPFAVVSGFIPWL
jgi:hypothetical protein